jgi:hypothetical protein
MSNCWDNPIANETDKAFEWFCRYRDYGADRSLDKVREKYGKKKAYVGQLEKWSRNFSWVSRALAYDVYRQKELQSENLEIEKERKRLEEKIWRERREQFRETQWEISQLLIQRGKEMLEYSLQERRWSFRDAAAMIQLGAQVGEGSAKVIKDVDIYQAIKVLVENEILPDDIVADLKETFDSITEEIRKPFERQQQEEEEDD